MAQYVFYRDSICEYYAELAEFLLITRTKQETKSLKSALNMNLILACACYVEGVMEKTAKSALGYHRLVYNEIDIPQLELRKPMNMYFRRMEADIYQRVSQATGVDNYDRLFELLLGISFKNDDVIKMILEPLQVLFQLRNVIAHGKEISAYKVSAYWNNNVFEENFLGGYKKAENFLVKKGLLKERYTDAECVEYIFIDEVADYFYGVARELSAQLRRFVEAHLEIGDVIYDRLRIYNEKNNTNLSVMDFCELNAHAIQK